MIRSPANYDPDEDAEALENRFDYVLDGMVAKGWLRPRRAGRHAGAEDGRPRKKPKGGPNYYLLDSVRRELKAQGFTDQDIDLGGLRVVTTFDRKAQRAAVRAVRQERPRENARNVHIGLSAVQPGTGAVIAMYGGSNAGELNEATQARVQPGSSFKPFALTAALATTSACAAGSTATRRRSCRAPTRRSTTSSTSTTARRSTSSRPPRTASTPPTST